MTEQTEARAAATALGAAFGPGDVARYFACFAPDATFLFHTTDRLLGSREAYRQEWRRWEREDGFRVLSCESYDQRVQHLSPDPGP